MRTIKLFRQKFLLSRKFILHKNTNVKTYTILNTILPTRILDLCTTVLPENKILVFFRKCVQK